MARSPKHAPAPSTATTPSPGFHVGVMHSRMEEGMGLPEAGPSRLAHASFDAASSTPGGPARASARASARRSSVANMHADHSSPGSTPQTPIDLTLNPFAAASHGSGSRHAPKPLVEPKVHGLRHAQGDREKVPAPFPAAYGGKEKCALHDDDEKDEVFVAICSALAEMANKALSPDEIANLCFDNGWLRQPTAAVAPANMISSAIRSHQKRCDCATPSRPHLVAKYQLSGSVNETCLAPALHPNAFDNIRPKGTVWYLATVGRTKWKNPFEGIDVPKAMPKKLAGHKKKSDKAGSADKYKKDLLKDGKKGKDATSAVKPRILLKVGTLRPKLDDDEMSEGGSSSGSRSRSWSIASGTPIPGASSSTSASISVPPSRLKPTRHPQSDTDSDSETSDSDIEIPNYTEIHRRPALRHSRSARKGPPAPLDLSHSAPSSTSFLFNDPLFGGSSSRALPSAFGELFHPYSPAPPMLPTLSSQTQGQLHSSPFPSHSLDNTFWAARSHSDRMEFESSSSSSDDEMLDLEYGAHSGILIRGIDGDESPELATPAEPIETSVKEATDALRDLYAIQTATDQIEEVVDFGDHRLDIRPTSSETGSVTESVSTLHAQAISQGLMRGNECHIALAPLPLNSSPIASPAFRSFLPLPVDISPSQHVSRLRDSFDSEAMEVDIGPDESIQWLDEAGELPVKAEDTLSDIDLNSTIGDLVAPEHDRRRDTAEWAREAAASFHIKDEPVEDFPSPLTNPSEGENPSPRAFDGSRASSASAETHTPSSRMSELPPFDIDDTADLAEMIRGPESLPVDEIDGWLVPGVSKEKTPKRRGRPPKARPETPIHAHTLPKAKCGGIWGDIGVGTPFTTPFKKSTTAKAPPPSLIRSRSKRASLRSQRKDDAVTSDIASDIVSIVSDGGSDVEEAIGTADLERVCAEADEREEQRRLICRQKAEQQRALLEAYRQSMREAMDLSPATELSTPAAWPDFGPAPWGSGSTESVALLTPSVVSPMILHSVSTLSLRDVGVDPKSLLSPANGRETGLVAQTSDASSMAVDDALASVDGLAMLDEVLSQAEVEAVIQTASPSPGSEIIQSSTVTRPGLSGHAILGSPLSSASASPVPGLGKSGSLQAKEVSATPSAGSSVSAEARTTAPPTAAGAPNGGRQYARILKPLCAGVVASVVDNIPVYSHTPDGDKSKTPVLRRLDTDFVNGSTLLSALGLPAAKHTEFLARPSRWQQYRHPVQPICSKTHHAYHTGVAGVWITLVEARAIAKQFKLDEAKQLSSLLKEDLFSIFAAMANLSNDHHAAMNFGLPFTAEGPNFYLEPPTVRSRPVATQPAAAAASNTTFAQSSAHSKSTPNLPALSASAPGGRAPIAALKTPLKISLKSQLVRPAPPTPPDNDPQPKRRRATIIGAKPEIAGPANSPKIASPAAGNAGTPSHANAASGVGARNATPVGKGQVKRRATRASISSIGKPRVEIPLAPSPSAGGSHFGAAQGTRAKGGPVVSGVGA